MNLTVSTPSAIILERDNVLRIVAESKQGFFGILPHRLDCTACLVPGILLYETEQEGERYVAVDEGLLVKVGAHVHVATRAAREIILDSASSTAESRIKELGRMSEVLGDEMLSQSEQEKHLRISLAKLESDFMRHLLEIHRHG